MNTCFTTTPTTITTTTNTTKTNTKTHKKVSKQNYLRDGDGDAVKGCLSLDSVHNDSSATKHINQNLHPINCTLTFHRNLQRQKCRQSNKQTTNKEIQKQTNQTNIRSKQTIKHKQKQANKTNKQTNKSKQTDKPTHDQARCRRTTRANAQDLL
jgi:hypothetical protein